ncbi:hypothetical protein [Archangium lansingense]|uniref:Lipoprotein n=1 Tax=Archangium lansingense TaxID=2995310 RepID=A0ABT4AK07_9BACT|nr:hypothetical protein [Archangium lansinium]MCY1081499.1 hypothetical protein [Archangium lansinium]
MNKLVWCVASLGLLGCGALVDLTGIETSSAHCDFRQSGPNGREDRCQERVEVIKGGIEPFKGLCTSIGAVAGDGPCPREGVVGGCFIGEQGDGSDVNDWYYAPMTREDVRGKCTSREPFLEP